MLAAPAVLVSLLAGAPAPSNSSAAPCLWDRDTLAVEAEGEEALIDVLVGRFDRFPPQYYEVRLERTRDEVERVPDDLSLYDDAGVACDRLGRADEAIEWMARKRRVLDGLSEPDAFHEEGVRVFAVREVPSIVGRSRSSKFPMASRHRGP